MNAAKKIRQFSETEENLEPVQVLKDLAAALELGKPFDLQALYEVDMRYFDVAIQLLKDWRFDRHIASRSKLVQRLFVQMRQEEPQSMLAADLPNATQQAPEQAAKAFTSEVN